jgi:corrinoid protein of di/trimethylamine methyltransferase
MSTYGRGVILVSESIAALISEGEEDRTLEEVRKAMDENADPLSIVEALRAGMTVVGDKYEAREYFLPDLVLSAEIFKEAIALIEPRLQSDDLATRGTVVIGTVQGDVHDIGKNIVATMLKCNGYQVHDLGVDVAPQSFVEEARETGAGLVAMSGLLTLAFNAMKDTVDALAEAGLRDRLKIIIGGGPVNEKVLEYCGADAYGKDPSEAVKLANQHLG